MRSGTRSECKRRYREKGSRPLCRMKLGYEYCYLYAALQPFEGQLISLILPDMTKESFKVFMDYFYKETQQRYGNEHKVLLFTDGAGAHQPTAIAHPAIILQKLPPASPELNPVERFFEELRKALSNQIFDTIEDLEDKLCEVLQQYYQNPTALISLTNYPYLSTS
jgi:putative transposase